MGTRLYLLAVLDLLTGKVKGQQLLVNIVDVDLRPAGPAEVNNLLVSSIRDKDSIEDVTGAHGLMLIHHRRTCRSEDTDWKNKENISHVLELGQLLANLCTQHEGRTTWQTRSGHHGNCDYNITTTTRDLIHLTIVGRWKTLNFGIPMPHLCYEMN